VNPADAPESGMIVYKYGCPARADFDEPAMEQLRLANDLWNRLVEIDRAHQEEVAAIWAEHPEVAVAQKTADEAQEACDAITAEIRRQRQQDRSTVPRSHDTARLATARKARSEAKAALKAAKESAMERMRPLFTEAAAQRRQALKQARQDSASAGLYWGTYNDICQRRFPTAAKHVTEQRKQGRRAELRFRRFDGTGTLTTQVMWQAGDPPATAALLASGEGKWRNVVQFGPWSDPDGADRPRGKERHGTLRLRVSSSHHVTIPVVIHRFIPAGAEVKEIKVTRHRIGGNYRLSVAVACRIPAPAPKHGGLVLDIDFGWASGGPDVGLRVARVSSDAGAMPAPPPEVAALVTEGDWHEIWCPAQWRDLAGRPDAIRADRDDLLSQIRDLCAGALAADASLAARIAERNEESWRKAGKEGQPPGITAASVGQWRAQRKLALLARLWPQDHPLAGELEQWRKRDRHLWEFEANERDQITGRRRDAYRKVAAWLAGCAELIVIKDLDIASLRRRPAAEEDTYQARGARRNAHFAAPGELRAAVEHAARARGVQVIYRTEETASE
jgi:hypothetical protein